MARNRYGWEKRAKEIARKQKSDEKMKKRQNRATAEEPKKNLRRRKKELLRNNRTLLQIGLGDTIGIGELCRRLRRIS